MNSTRTRNRMKRNRDNYIRTDRKMIRSLKELVEFERPLYTKSDLEAVRREGRIAGMVYALNYTETEGESPGFNKDMSYGYEVCRTLIQDALNEERANATR